MIECIQTQPRIALPANQSPPAIANDTPSHDAQQAKHHRRDAV